MITCQIGSSPVTALLTHFTQPNRYQPIRGSADTKQPPSRLTGAQSVNNRIEAVSNKMNSASRKENASKQEASSSHAATRPPDRGLPVTHSRVVSEHRNRGRASSHS